MDKFIYPDLSKEKRVETMAKLCLRTEQTDYARTLDEGELVAEKDAYSREAISLEAIELEEKQTKAEYASKKKALKSIMEQRLKIVKNGKRAVNGKLFLFADQISNVMNYYDQYGELITSRPLRPEEKQTKMYIGEDGKTASTAAEESQAGNDNHITDVDFEEVKDQPEAEAPAPKKAATKGSKKTKPTGEDINEKVAGMINKRKAEKDKAAASEEFPGGNVEQPLQKMDTESPDELGKTDPFKEDAQAGELPE